jgi:hypothetical protein
MLGTLHIFPANPETPTREIQLERPITQKEIEDAVGGSIGFVTNFDTITYKGKVSLCYAFCDEEARKRKRPLNRLATLLWSRALIRRFGAGQAKLPETLMGSIAIITGDSEFLEAL